MTGRARAAESRPRRPMSQNPSQNPGFAAAMNGLATSGGTSKYVTYTFTGVAAVVPRAVDVALPHRRTSRPARTGTGAGRVLAIVVGESPFLHDHDRRPGMSVPARKPAWVDDHLLDDGVRGVVDLGESLPRPAAVNPEPSSEHVMRATDQRMASSRE